MTIGLKHEKGYLDREHCFRTWLNCNSIGKTVNILYSEGVKNPRTGKAPTPMGVWGSAWLWALENVPEAKKLTFDAWRNNGTIGTDLEWNTLVLGKARYLLSNRQYELFIEKHSYLKPLLEK